MAFQPEETSKWMSPGHIWGMGLGPGVSGLTPQPGVPPPQGKDAAGVSQDEVLLDGQVGLSSVPNILKEEVKREGDTHGGEMEGHGLGPQELAESEEPLGLWRKQGLQHLDGGFWTPGP